LEHDEYHDTAELSKQLKQLLADGQQLRQLLIWAAIGRELVNALGGCKSLTLKRRHGWYEGQALGGAVVFMEELANVLGALNGDVPTRKCAGPCGRTLSLSQFSRNKNLPLGRCMRCRKCETARVRSYQAKGRR
jgi:hypothetical protein